MPEYSSKAVYNADHIRNALTKKPLIPLWDLGDYQNVNLNMKWLQEHTERALLLLTKSNEAKTRFLLEHWVSELEPALAFDENLNIIGLTPADTPIGIKGFILYLEECA